MLNCILTFLIFLQTRSFFFSNYFRSQLCVKRKYEFKSSSRLSHISQFSLHEYYKKNIVPSPFIKVVRTDLDNYFNESMSYNILVDLSVRSYIDLPILPIIDKLVPKLESADNVNPSEFNQ